MSGTQTSAADEPLAVEYRALVRELRHANERFLTATLSDLLEIDGLSDRQKHEMRGAIALALQKPHTPTRGSTFGEMRVADLREANEHLMLAALHAETIAATAEHNLSELTRASQRDELTGTANRTLMLDRIESAIGMAQRHIAHVAVLFIDLDNFKQVNDTWGHAVGDEVLQRVARRLESVVRATDTVSRHGGDEFLVLLTEVSQRAYPAAITATAAIAANMLLELAKPDPAAPQLPCPSVSIGIGLYPEDGADPASLISCADAAMYRAKQNGRNRFEFHAEDIGFTRSERLGIGARSTRTPDTSAQ